MHYRLSRYVWHTIGESRSFGREKRFKKTALSNSLFEAEVEVIWTKSKRTATFFSGNLPLPSSSLSSSHAQLQKCLQGCLPRWHPGRAEQGWRGSLRRAQSQGNVHQGGDCWSIWKRFSSWLWLKGLNWLTNLNINNTIKAGGSTAFEQNVWVGEWMDGYPLDCYDF